ncbi:MAG TPA: class I SAM-dependent methyltransferase [Allosphingosinicella sp.]|jgi:SAM-dependent methyltransferase
MKARIERFVARRLLALVEHARAADAGQLQDLAQRVSLLELNVKGLGYELARKLAAALPVATGTEPVFVGLKSKATTQGDLESDWARHWTAELEIPLIFHRKIWELAFVLQAVWEQGHIRPGARGLGFGCGVEPIPSYLASRGAATTVTDLPHEEAAAAGWVSTNQHASGREQAFHAHLVDRAAFERLVDFQVVDMNAIPPSLAGYDFCWSVCAMEHLGSIEKGLAFAEASLATLRPGGTAIHTMELNIAGEGPTLDNHPTVLFQRKHVEEVAARLRAQGHNVAELDFDFGARALDRFVDVAPWTHELPADLGGWLGPPLHLKIGFHGFITTCFGLVVTKGG